jgi:hypothetical protein
MCGKSTRSTSSVSTFGPNDVPLQRRRSVSSTSFISYGPTCARYLLIPSSLDGTKNVYSLLPSASPLMADISAVARQFTGTVLCLPPSLSPRFKHDNDRLTPCVLSDVDSMANRVLLLALLYQPTGTHCSLRSSNPSSSPHRFPSPCPVLQ